MCSYITENLLLLHMTNNLIQYKTPNNLLSKILLIFSYPFNI